MMTAAILLLLVLTWGGVRFAWTSPQIIGLLIGSAVLWLAFTWRLTHTDEPFLPLAVLANPVVRAGTLAASFAVGSQIGLTIYMPLYYENVHGLSASNAGWALIPIAVMTTPGSILSGPGHGAVRALQVVAHDRAVGRCSHTYFPGLLADGAAVARDHRRCA